MRRPRMTIRRWMIVVAVAATAVAGVAIPLHRLRLADHHRDVSIMLELQATGGKQRYEAPEHLEGAYVEAVRRTYGDEAAGVQERAFAHRRLARAYRRLAYRPWLPVEPDPPEP